MLTGLPPGVVNLVFGTGPKAGAPIVKHPDIPVVSFTGSTATGQAITEMSAPFYKKLSLEVSAKSEHLLHDFCIIMCSGLSVTFDSPFALIFTSLIILLHVNVLYK